MKKINKKFGYILDSSGVPSWSVKNDEAITSDGTPYSNPAFSFDSKPGGAFLFPWQYPFLFEEGHFINWRKDGKLPDIDLDIIFFSVEKGFSEFKIEELRKKYPNAKIAGYVKETWLPHQKFFSFDNSRYLGRIEHLKQCDAVVFHELDLGPFRHLQDEVGIEFSCVRHPIDVDYDKDPDLEFVEDGDWALVRKYVHASTVIDSFYESLTEEQVLELEEPRQSDPESYLLYRQSRAGSDPNTYRNRLIEVVNVYWKSRKRVGFLEYMDPETGSMEEMEVDETFRLPKEMKEQGAKVTYLWVNEVWEGTRIDGRMYVNINPVANQRLSLDNSSTCKLPINGRKYSDINADNISLVSLGIPYQLNYNIYKYRLELAIARSKDIIAQFDINLIPKKWDMDKFMYYVEGTGIAWVDYNKEGIQLNPQHQSVLDMSIKTIQQYVALLESILNEWEKLSGVSRQRQGTIGAYEGKASSQQAIVQSSHITEDLFRKFGRLEQRDLQALVDYSKEAWLTGKQGMFVMPDGTTDFLDLDSMQHMESNYGIFVSDSGKDIERLDQMKQLAQAMMQNGSKGSTIAEVLESESFTQIKGKLKAAEKAQEELEQAQQQAEQQQAQQQMQMEQAKAEQELIENEKDRQKDIEIALIGAESRKNPEADAFNMQKMMADFEMRQKELSVRERELEARIADDAEKRSIDREKNKDK